MPKRKDGFNEAPISFPGAELRELRERYELEFGATDIGLEGWAEEFREQAEGRLYVFAKYILRMHDLTAELHGKTADWLQDTDTSIEHELTRDLRVRGGRRKLLMLPIGHLKTSLASHALPLHAIIQPEGGLYFPEMKGRDIRILLHGETEKKAKQNLSVIKQNLEFNKVLRWLWPAPMWEKRKDADLWTDDQITVRRSGERYLPEPTIIAIGVETGLEQQHFDLIIPDD